MAAFYGAKERKHWYGVSYSSTYGIYSAEIVDPLTGMLLGFNLSTSAYDAAKIRKYALLLMPSSISKRIQSDFIPDATDDEAINAMRDPSTITWNMFPYDISVYITAVQAATPAAPAAAAPASRGPVQKWSPYNDPDHIEWLKELNSTHSHTGGTRRNCRRRGMTQRKRSSRGRRF
jgi:hypothetical protein